MQSFFEQEYIKIEKSLYLVAIGYLHNTEDAKDVMQEAAISAYCSYGTLKHKEYFKTWLTRIVINKSKDFLRRKKYTEELIDELDVFHDTSMKDLEIIDAICKLNCEDAKYITLRFYNDMTYDEVAKLLGKPVSTVKYKTKNAMEQLKNLLEGDVEA